MIVFTQMPEKTAKNIKKLEGTKTACFEYLQLTQAAETALPDLWPSWLPQSNEPTIHAAVPPREMPRENENAMPLR